MTAVSAFQRFFWGDYLRDTMHLSTEEHGAYLLLIAAYWTRGRAPADDDRQLAAITKLSPKKWRKVRPAVAEFFDIWEGHWIHQRIERDLAEARQSAEVSRENGKRGGRPRKPRQNPTGFQNETQNKPASESQSESISSTSDEVERSRARDAAPLDRTEPIEPRTAIAKPPDPPGALDACLGAAGPGLADPAKTPQLHLTAPRIAAWLAAGCDLAADIMPVIAARTAQPRASPISTWSYFEAAVIEARNRRLGAPPPPATLEHAHETELNRARRSPGEQRAIRQAAALRVLDRLDQLEALAG